MSTLKTNNIQHVDRSDPSIIINTDGSVNIAGTMTYEDVTNVDAVGIITGRSNIDAQKQIHVGTGVSVKAGGINVTAGITTVQALQATSGTFSAAVSGTTGTFTGDVDIADKIVHTGDTDTAIRFSSADTISIETGGITRATVTGNTIDFPDAGTLRFGGSQDLQIYHGTGGASNIIHSNTSQPLIIHASGAGTIRFDTNSNERLRIDSNGMIGIGGVTPKTQNTFDAIEFGKTGFLGSQTGARTVEMASNAYYNSGWKYKEADVASQYYQYQAAHIFTSATSGSADGAITFTERLKIDSSGRVMIGGVAASQTNRSLALGSNSEANLAIETHNDAGSESANIRFYKSGGTGASPTAVSDNDYISQLIWYGHDGTDYGNTVGYMRMQVDGTVASNQVPGELEFGINDGSSATRAMTIHKTGNVLFSGLTAKNDPRNAKGIALKNQSGGGGISFQNFGSNGSRNWRIRQDDMTGWGTLEFSVSPTANDATDWPDAAGDVVMSLESGNVKLTNSDLVMGSGKGISFAATGNGSGSSSSELFDDYEEGSFTPAYQEGSGGGNMLNNVSYNNTTGYYTKIGGCVTFSLRIQCSSHTVIGGHVKINGLPYAQGASNGKEGGAFFNYSQAVDTSNSGYLPTMHISNNASAISFYTTQGNAYQAGAGGTNWNLTLHITGVYHTF